MKFVGPWKLMPVALVALTLLAACGNNKYAKQTHSATATANQYITIKPKLDIVVFQDNSDSVMFNGPITVLKPQMQQFLNSMSDQWDMHFTVLPLLSTMSISYKYVVASNCSDITGVLGCLSPSQASNFNNSSSDYGWINSVNSSVGSNDRGFQNIKANLSQSGMTSSGFLRNDAALAIVVISNSDDMEGVVAVNYGGSGTMVIKDPDSYQSSTATNSFSGYYNYLNGLKGGSGLSKFYSVVSTVGACSIAPWKGKRYIDMANALGSRAYDICSGELGIVMNDLKQQLVAVAEAIRFNYVVVSADKAPVVSSIKVLKNGALIPQNNVNGWTYVGYKSNQPTSYYPTNGNVRSGYMIQLNGSAEIKGSDSISIDFDPI